MDSETTGKEDVINRAPQYPTSTGLVRRVVAPYDFTPRRKGANNGSPMVAVRTPNIGPRTRGRSPSAKPELIPDLYRAGALRGGVVPQLAVVVTPPGPEGAVRLEGQAVVISRGQGRPVAVAADLHRAESAARQIDFRAAECYAREASG